MANLKKLNINGTAYNLVDAEGRELIKNINDVTIPAINEDVERVEGKVDTLIGSDSNMSARAIVQDEVTKQLTSENISESFDTLREMAEYLSSHPEDVTEINNRLKANEDGIEAINDGLNTFMEGTVGESNGNGTIFSQLTSINSELESLGGGAGSIANQIKAEIDKLDAEVTSTDGTNVQVKVTEVDGKITGVNITKDTTYSKPSTGIPLADLAEGVKTSLGKADNAYQKPSTGIPKNDLASGVKTSLDNADTAVQHMEVDVESQDYLEIESGVDNTGRTFYLNVVDVNSATAKGQGLADAYDVKEVIEAVDDKVKALATGIDANFTEVENAYNNLGKKVATATKETFSYDAETETLTITSSAI